MGVEVLGGYKGQFSIISFVIIQEDLCWIIVKCIETSKNVEHWCFRVANNTDVPPSPPRHQEYYQKLMWVSCHAHFDIFLGGGLGRWGLALLIEWLTGCFFWFGWIPGFPPRFDSLKGLFVVGHKYGQYAEPVGVWKNVEFFRIKEINYRWTKTFKKSYTNFNDRNRLETTIHHSAVIR